MNSRLLITTADERTWELDTPVLFLGEWCRIYSRRQIWENISAEVVPYHWDDRDKLKHDFDYIQQLCEELLFELTDQLNSLHGVNYSPRYWHIQLGTWLHVFVSILFDRWSMIFY